MANKQLTENEVKHVAHLSRLELSSEDLEKFKQQLSSVVSYIDELSEVDTDGIEPTSQTTGLENVVREDEIDANKILPVSEAISGSEDVHNNYFVVPMTLEERTV